MMQLEFTSLPRQVAISHLVPFFVRRYIIRSYHRTNPGNVQLSWNKNNEMPSPSDTAAESPPNFGRTGKLRGFLRLNSEEPTSPLAVNGQGHLNALIRSRSSTSLQSAQRRPSTIRYRDEEDDVGSFGALVRHISRSGEDNSDALSQTEEERRMSCILNGPQMRSQRLIGNSNPRYKWERYWKTEEQLKTFKKPV